MNLNDLQMDALTQEGFLQPQLNEKTAAWLQSEIGIYDSESLPDLWIEFFDSKLVAEDQRNDRLFTYLSQLGFLQETLADKEYAWWLARSVAP